MAKGLFDGSRKGDEMKRLFAFLNFGFAVLFLCSLMEGCGSLDGVRKAAGNGDVEAMMALGNAYSSGQGVKRDSVEAMKWVPLAADHGNADAQMRVGNALEEGDGTMKDAAEAVKWFRLAADRGGPEARLKMGIAYEEGIGVPRDNAEAAGGIA